MTIVVVYPNRYDEGKPYSSEYDTEDGMMQMLVDDIPNGDHFPVIHTGPTFEGIELRFVEGCDPAALSGEARDATIDALLQGLDSARRMEHARALDHSWHYDQWCRGELEDESGMYDRQHHEWRDRWKRIAAAVKVHYGIEEKPS